MTLDEIRSTILASSAGDWEGIPGRAMFIHELGEARSGSGQRWVTVESHPNVAVYRDDVSLRIAWGLAPDHHNLSFEGWTFISKDTRRVYVDAFWQGALAWRWSLILADGGNCYLPDARPVIVGDAAHPAEYTTIGIPGYTATASEVALARLVNNLSSSYAAKAGFESFICGRRGSPRSRTPSPELDSTLSEPDVLHKARMELRQQPFIKLARSILELALEKRLHCGHADPALLCYAALTGRKLDIKARTPRRRARDRAAENEWPPLIAVG